MALPGWRPTGEEARARGGAGAWRRRVLGRRQRAGAGPLSPGGAGARPRSASPSRVGPSGSGWSMCRPSCRASTSSTFSRLHWARLSPALWMTALHPSASRVGSAQRRPWRSTTAARLMVAPSACSWTSRPGSPQRSRRPWGGVLPSGAHVPGRPGRAPGTGGAGRGPPRLRGCAAVARARTSRAGQADRHPPVAPGPRGRHLATLGAWACGRLAAPERSVSLCRRAASLGARGVAEFPGALNGWACCGRALAHGACICTVWFGKA
mmetsp:Transcript_5180/g.14285  ORF Transcript_5180/g.14285 Transcript_5180/m.14285 type:complete len:266 (+) Transcript_5180:305-1102(+)